MLGYKRGILGLKGDILWSLERKKTRRATGFVAATLKLLVYSSLFSMIMFIMVVSNSIMN